MKLLCQRRRANWQVLVVMSDREDCQILDFLHNIGTPAAAQMLGLLQQEIPTNGPRWGNKNYVEKLQGTDGIWEFKRGSKTGKRLRVLFFTDRRKRIVCTSAFEKQTPKTPPREIKRAERLKRQYLTDSDADRLEIHYID